MCAKVVVNIIIRWSKCGMAIYSQQPGTMLNIKLYIDVQRCNPWKTLVPFWSSRVHRTRCSSHPRRWSNLHHPAAWDVAVTTSQRREVVDLNTNGFLRSNDIKGRGDVTKCGLNQENCADPIWWFSIADTAKKQPWSGGHWDSSIRIGLRRLRRLRL